MKWLHTFYHKYPEGLLLLLAILVFISNLDALFVNIMEARNFITAREMLTMDNWIFTTMNDLPRYEKPPLPTWLTAISAYVFGISNVFAYRLPAALLSIFLVLIFYRMQLLLQIKKFPAFAGSVVLMTSFYVFFLGREGQWDIFTHSFMVGCCYFFIRIFQSPHSKYGNAVAAGLFFGASLLSKGPVSLYALFLPFLISYGVIYRFRNLNQNWKPLLVFLLVGIFSGGWWTVIVHTYDAAAFTEIAEVESSRWFSYNVRPFWYYWSFFTQSGIWTIPALLGLFYWYLKPKVSDLKAYQFYLLWTLISLFLLSVIPEKKSRYLLPVLIPLAMTTAFYIEYVIKNFRYFSATEKLPLYLNFGLLTLISFGAPIALFFLFESELWELTFTYILLSVTLLIKGLLFIFGIKKSHFKLLFSLQALLIIVIMMFGLPLVKLIDPERNSPNVAAIKSLAEKENLPVYDFKALLPELVWKYGEPLPAINENNLDDAADSFILLVEEESYPDWQNFFSNFEIEEKGILDLNPSNAKGSNERLIRNIYMLSKREP